jgi:outer membrane protein insertion porin family
MFAFFSRFWRSPKRTPFLLIAAILLIGTTGAQAIQPFKIKEIRVEGLQRIAVGTVFNYLPVGINDRFDDQKARESIRALFKTGYFKDVQLSREGNTLIVKVTERPSIASITIKGSKKFKSDELKKRLKEIGFAEGRAFDPSTFDQVELNLKRQYFSEGYYSVRIKHKVKPLPRNRVAVEFDVSEGRIALIESIRIVGNRAFSEKDLLHLFHLRAEDNVHLPFSKRDRYSKQDLQGDLETLRNYYLDKGYLDFSIDSTQVSITNDKEYIYITINVTEGKRYRISGYRVSGETILPAKEIDKLITIKPGDVFSRKVITGIVSKIGDKLGDRGYAFAKVNPVPEKNRDKSTVFLDFYINPGRRVYVRRINISGNLVTRDDVIRRELRQLEGSWYSVSRLRLSKERLQRLGFFDSVDITTPLVAGTTDEVDVDVKVKERSTGSISAGAGYSDANGFFMTLGYQERNAFGTGNAVTVNFDNSQATTTYEFRYNNPYYTTTGINRGFDIYSRYVDATVTGTGSYNTETKGAGIFYGFPISEDRKLSAGLWYEKVFLQTTCGSTGTSAQVACNFVNNYGDAVGIFKTTVGWSQNTLNSFLFPTRGGLYQVSAELGIPGADLEYYKADIRGSYYFPLAQKESTIRVRGEVGYGGGFGGTSELPFFKNYYAGGVNSVRGFRARGLGPIDPVSSEPIGGNKLVLGNVEYYFPFPGQKEGSSMRLSLFLDAGMVYGATDPLDVGQLRYSTGIAFNWFTPMFPISLSYGVPLNAQPGDQVDQLQFNIGLPTQ